MSHLEESFAKQLDDAGIEYKREQMLIPKRRFRCDFVIDNVIVECEGGVWSGGRHTRGAGFESDIFKYNKLTELGYIVLRYTNKAIKDGSALEQVKLVLEQRAA